MVRCVTQKWPADAHWEFDARLLGADAIGIWIGVAEGTLLARPTRAFHAASDHVVLIPHDDWWIATFYDDDPRRPVDTYVDITTPAVWEGDVVRAVDLDLDVVRRTDGSVFIDDDDEFQEHQLTLAYPTTVVHSAQQASARVLAAVKTDAAPFDRRTAAGWIAELQSIS